ncbi:hypothetical protein QVD17_21173 [Tagetes erecta]|uniref:RRM domain-containing protein n=1 Tax=Tagetes erecta TaxID=13708 RepID=A0AAD8KMW1_TARER|nr:hypothetical protein QVD17_21173 [Tagetes erecta]
MAVASEVHADDRNNIDGEWKIKEDRRRRLARSKANSKIISFFLSNFPIDLSSKQLGEICKPFGQLVDAFIPSKSAKNGGGKFGFVRFVHVSDLVKLLSDLNNIKIGGLKFSANLAKYDKSGNKVDYSSFSKLSRGYSDVNHVYHNSSKDPKGFNVNTHPLSKRSYCNVVSGKMDSSIPSISLSFDSESLKYWSGYSLVGEVIDMDSLCNLTSLLSNPVCGDLVIRYMWGMKVLISFKSSIEASRFLNDVSEIWSPLFKSLVIWKGQPIAQDRIAWVRISGIPLELWNYNTFDQIGGVFGRVVCKSSASLDDGNLSSDLIGVLVQHPGKISSLVEVCWKDTKLHAFVSEIDRVWCPDFISRSTSSAKHDQLNSKYCQSPVCEVSQKSTSTQGLQFSNQNFINPQKDSVCPLVNNIPILSNNPSSTIGPNNVDACLPSPKSFSTDKDSDPFGINNFIFNSPPVNCNHKRKSKLKSSIMDSRILMVNSAERKRARRCKSSSFTSTSPISAREVNTITNPLDNLNYVPSIDLNVVHSESLASGELSEAQRTANVGSESLASGELSEAQRTAKVGSMVGFEMDGFMDQIQVMVDADGVYNQS